ncbi:MAG: MOSC domain-containing protein [Hyphomicrobiaceae bacterium]|nr:MOSC domain-containing protein [Hyphomicrobiaceae bacterium]
MSDSTADQALRDVGRLVGIAWRPARRAPMQEVETASISLETGLEGDHKGLKFKNRAVTVLSREAWQAALAELSDLGGPVDLPWTARRANLLVEDVHLPRARGGIISIGPVRLEITYPTQPCKRMDEAHPGLLKALHPEWRGGVTARVLAPGPIRLGDTVSVLLRPAERTIRLPG